MQSRHGLPDGHPACSALTTALCTERKRFVAQARRVLRHGDRADAEDLVQDASMVVCTTLAAGSAGPVAMAPWLGGCVRTLGRRYCAEATRRAVHLRLVAPWPDVAVSEPDEQSCDRARARAALPAMLEALPQRNRDAVQARIVDELSWPEVSRRLGITPDQARHAVALGLATLRARGVAAGLWTREDVGMGRRRDSTAGG